jgi:hypothetical protein
LLLAGSIHATTFLRLQSSYLGSGWFQYQMTVLNDPFFSQAKITTLKIWFADQINQGKNADGWVNAPDSAQPHYSDWTPPAGTTYPARPYQETFLLQSTNTTFKTGNNSATAVMSLVTSKYYPQQPGSVTTYISGYDNLSCLIPCDPADADNSPTNYETDAELLPDIQVEQLIVTNGQVQGVDFDWYGSATFMLQGTADFVNWTNVACIWSSPPETVWTTNIDLGGYGPFYRVALMTDGYTNLSTSVPTVVAAPKVSTGATKAAGTPMVTGCQFSNGRVVVSLGAGAGQTVVVEALNSHQSVVQSQRVVSQGAGTTAVFDPASLPNPVFFQATAVP